MLVECLERLERLERIDGILSALAFPTKNRLRH